MFLETFKNSFSFLAPMEVLLPSPSLFRSQTFISPLFLLQLISLSSTHTHTDSILCCMRVKWWKRRYLNLEEWFSTWWQQQKQSAPPHTRSSTPPMCLCCSSASALIFRVRRHAIAARHRGKPFFYVFKNIIIICFLAHPISLRFC